MNIVHAFDGARVDRDDEIAGLQAGGGRRGIRFDVRDLDGALPWQPECARKAP